MLILMLAITPSNIQAFCVTNDSIAGQADSFHNKLRTSGDKLASFKQFRNNKSQSEYC